VTAVLHLITDPFAEPVNARALAEVALLGIAGGALGCWIVFYELAYGTESLAHSMFPGLVVAALIGAPLLAGGAAGILVAALAIALARRVPAIGGDTAIAVVVTTLFGLGAVLALSPESPPGVQELLFGDVLGVTDLDLALGAALTAVVVVALRVLHVRLLAVGFDRTTARTLGASPALADTALLVLVALAVLVAVQGMGNLLVVAVLVGPAATARLLARRMAPMMALAVAIGVVAGAGGLYLSFYAGTAAGASIAGVIVAVYLLAAAVSGRATRSAVAAWRQARPRPRPSSPG
jgi:ABC-type Mn2+/Zn2+ transport system permease subunit